MKDPDTPDTPATLPFPAEPYAEGWYHPRGAHRAHWFRAGRSLCGAHVLPPGVLLIGRDSGTRATCGGCEAIRDRTGGPPAA